MRCKLRFTSFAYRYPILVQSLIHIWLFVTPWIAIHQASLSFTVSGSLLKLMSIELMMPTNHLILCHFLHLMSSIFPNIRVFSSESALHIRWPKYWSFSFSICPSNEYSMISFRIGWFDLLAVHRTLKSLLLHRSSKASVLSVNIRGWFPLGLTGLISLLFKGLSRVFSRTIVGKHQFFGTQPSLWSSSHILTWLEKP